MPINTTSLIKVTILTPAHNEAEIIEKCIQSVKKLEIPKHIELKHVVIADRCQDATVQKCKQHGIKVIEKHFRGKCVSPITDAMMYGLKNANGEVMGKVDADVILPHNWLIELLPHLDEHTLSVASDCKSASKFMHLRNLLYKITPLGRTPRGAARILNMRLLRKIKGFDKSKPTWDTALDLKAQKHGLLSKFIPTIIAIEQRTYTILQLLKRQLRVGKIRRQLDVSLFRTLLHSLFRGRFLVIIGYLLETRRLKQEVGA